MVLYRLYPTRHLFLFRALRAAMAISVFSTITEIAIVGWLYGALFDRWSTLNKALTPMLFFAFILAQIWSAICLWRIGNSRRAMIQGGGRGGELELGNGEVAKEVKVGTK